MKTKLTIFLLSIISILIATCEKERLDEKINTHYEQGFPTIVILSLPHNLAIADEEYRSRLYYLSLSSTTSCSIDNGPDGLNIDNDCNLT